VFLADKDQVVQGMPFMHFFLKCPFMHLIIPQDTVPD
jgi:hypothetical protein